MRCFLDDMFEIGSVWLEKDFMSVLWNPNEVVQDSEEMVRIPREFHGGQLSPYGTALSISGASSRDLRFAVKPLSFSIRRNMEGTEHKDMGSVFAS